VFSFRFEVVRPGDRYRITGYDIALCVPTHANDAAALVAAWFQRFSPFHGIVPKGPKSLSH
jgi:hypothetical protein